MSRCAHQKLLSDPSPHAQEVGYRRPSKRQLSAATRLSGQLVPAGTSLSFAKDEDVPGLFPAPLVLPHDEIAYDPQDSGQSVQEWNDLPSRNSVTSARRTIYIVAPPSVSAEVAGAKDWASPKLRLDAKPYARGSKAKSALAGFPHPSVEDVIDYLKAFYHPLPVKSFRNSALEIISWDDAPCGKSAKLQYVALSHGTSATRIRVRPSPDGIFSGQLNLNDLLDVAIEVLPKDAYALLMLVNQDLYEDDDDDFCCGRAYGGSRVAVVSSARYNPLLDAHAGIDRTHAWPASHCQVFVDTMVGAQESHRPRKKRSGAPAAVIEQPGDTALHAAVRASLSVPHPTTPASLSALWSGRICKTVSHEIGHCFGIGHCVHYACIMQGTASIIEDSRQPPYLCPIDRSKVLRSTGAQASARYAALQDFCQRFAEVDSMFAAFAAWLRHGHAPDPPVVILD